MTEKKWRYRWIADAAIPAVFWAFVIALFKGWISL